MKLRLTMIAGVLLLSMAHANSLRAENTYDAWLRYSRLDERAAQQYASLPAATVMLGHSPVVHSAQAELIRGVKGMLGKTLRAETGPPRERAVVLGTLAEVQRLAPLRERHDQLRDDAFWITTTVVHGFECLIVSGTTDRGVLYGVFALLSKIARNESIATINELQQPSAPLRWVNQWDNLNGTIERGYAGPSIFFEDGSVRSDLTRAADYARLLASMGINGCTINNVNANPKMLESSFLPQIARIADAFRPWGVRLSLSVDLSSPKVMGGLDTFDPADPAVAKWWREKMNEVYQLIPDFGGVVVKADSEGRLGPSTYGRSPADAANVIARALKSHAGVVFYRAFVYNHHLDWTNPKNDRAKAAYDNFHPLDGKFDDNVVIQIKYGPIDFQVREPVSPLFGGLQKTNEAIELQITQEYTGQQRHLCLLPPMWKEVLDFDLEANGGVTPVRELISGKTFRRPTGGFVGVANVGMDNWLGNPLAMANLYGFGRLAWDPNLSARAIVDEWTRLTFGNDPVVVRGIVDIELSSWPIYESYTGPLGAGTLTNILGSHYGPGPESSERNGWGQWHRADHEGIGMDRTLATGTGYVGQYPPPVAKIYESLQSTPDELLLFFHHVPYTYKLHSGKTVIQHIYDSHYEGAERVRDYVRQWQSIKGHMDNERYTQILERFEYQAGHAIVWRDAICNWFHRLSGIADQQGRVGNHPDRIEAESMQLGGYAPFDADPWESASGGRGVQCVAPAESCTAKFRFDRPAGSYAMDVQYFDQNNGESKFHVFVNDQEVNRWIASDHLPAAKPNADASTRRHIMGLSLHLGDEIRIEGRPDGQELAPFDYVELQPASP